MALFAAKVMFVSNPPEKRSYQVHAIDTYFSTVASTPASHFFNRHGRGVPLFSKLTFQEFLISLPLVKVQKACTTLILSDYQVIAGDTHFLYSSTTAATATVGGGLSIAGC